MSLPIIEVLAREIKHSASVAKLNIDEQPEAASTYEVNTVMVIHSCLTGISRRDEIWKMQL